MPQEKTTQQQIDQVQLKTKYRLDYQPPHFTISEVDLCFDLNETKTKVIAESKVHRQGKHEHELILDGKNLKLIQLLVDGQEWPHYKQDTLTLTIKQLPDNFCLTIETEINPKENTSCEGLYKSGEAYCTQCEAEGFRHITYFLDRPDVLARYRTKVIADKKSYPYLLSNGNKTNQGNLADGKHWIQWQDPFPKPAYLFALVAGDFDCLQDNFITKSGRDIKLEIFVDKGNLARAQHAMISLKKAMKWDETRFNLEYDLDIYMIVAVDFFNMGAMENKGLNVFNSHYVLADPNTATDTEYQNIEAVIGHEYFHNWTGNRITCRDWFQLSLKEGLTVFRDQEFSSDMGSRAVNRISNVKVIRGPQFAEDASPMAHPIRPDAVIQMNNFYTLTVYEKGSEVIRMLHAILGEQLFQAGMALYITRFDGMAVTCDDFVETMQEASGTDLTLFKHWYSQSGTPTITVTDHYDPKQARLTLSISQQTEATLDQKDKKPLLIPIDLSLYDQKGNTIAMHCDALVTTTLHGTLRHFLHLTEQSQTFVFNSVTKKPVISLLQGFSAPVRVIYDQVEQDILCLIHNAEDQFTRWDNVQKLLATKIKELVAAYADHDHYVQVEAETAVTISLMYQPLITELLSDLTNKDLALQAQLFTLPSFSEIAGWFKQVDINAIDAAQKLVRQEICQLFVKQWQSIYNQLAQTEYSTTGQAIAKRALRNIALYYLAHSDLGSDLVEKHYLNANNMTDIMAALNAANDAQLNCRQQLMDAYSKQWAHDGLVMDKWFTLQGRNPEPTALQGVIQQFDHPAFDFKNPNRIRSLIGAFVNMNPTNFHEISGSGYHFLSEILVKLNDSNPQVASRLITPLLELKRYDNERQQLMRTELQRLRDIKDLSPDLFEKIEKALT